MKETPRHEVLISDNNGKVIGVLGILANSQEEADERASQIPMWVVSEMMEPVKSFDWCDDCFMFDGQHDLTIEH